MTNIMQIYVFLSTFLGGLLVFHALVFCQGLREFVRDLKKSLPTRWCVMPKVHQPWMTRRPGVLTVDPEFPEGVVR